MKQSSLTIPFPLTKPRALQPPEPALDEPAVEAFTVTVTTSWSRVSVPVKPSVHKFLTAQTENVQRSLGRTVGSSSLKYYWEAQAGKRTTDLELLLLRADYQVRPTASSRRNKTVTLEMESRSWNRIRQLAEFYQRPSVAMLQALLLERIEGLHAFHREQAQKASNGTLADLSH